MIYLLKGYSVGGRQNRGKQNWTDSCSIWKAFDINQESHRILNLPNRLGIQKELGWIAAMSPVLSTVPCVSITSCPCSTTLLFPILINRDTSNISYFPASLGWWQIEVFWNVKYVMQMHVVSVTISLVSRDHIICSTDNLLSGRQQNWLLGTICG